MPIPLMSSPSTASTLIQCVIRTSATGRRASLVPTAASTLASLIMTLSTKSFCHRRSKKQPQQYKFERAQFEDDRKEKALSPMLRRVTEPSLMRQPPTQGKGLNDVVIDASGSCFDVFGAECVNNAACISSKTSGRDPLAAVQSPI